MVENWLSDLLGEDWQAWLVYLGALIVLITGLGYGFWKGPN